MHRLLPLASMSIWMLVRSLPTVSVDQYSKMVSRTIRALHLRDANALCIGKRLYVPLFTSPTVPAGTSGPTVAAAPTTAKTVFASDMVMLRLRTLSEYEDMARNKWGISEPPLNYKDGTVREEGK